MTGKDPGKDRGLPMRSMDRERILNLQGDDIGYTHK